MTNPISGYTCVRNALELDYPVELTIRSMLPVCEEVVVCDSDSTDGTKDLLSDIAARESKVRIINRAWEQPFRQTDWWVRWLNSCRGHLRFPMQLQLDADEVLDDSELCHFAIRGAADTLECRRFNRLNFWRDAKSLIPDGHCCGKYVARLGPRRYHMPSDEPHHKGECQILDESKYHPDLQIFHLGFLRRRESFYKKANVVLHAFFGRYDARLESAEKEGKELWESECDFTHLLEPYTGRHPEAVKHWMEERGHAL